MISKTYRIFSLNHILNRSKNIAACINAINHSNKVKENNNKKKIIENIKK